jgi:phosphoserine phosphatase RsbU/P
MYKLNGTDGEKYYSWALEPGSYIIGRKPENDFPIPHKTVSRKHAQIEVSANGKICSLTDLGSHNGTTVNNLSIKSTIKVLPGDTIQFGQTEFQISEADQSDQLQTPMPKTKLASVDPQQSVVMSIDETMRPLPRKATDLPDLLPTILQMAKLTGLADSKDELLDRCLKMISRVIPAERYVILFVSEDQDDVYTAASLIPDKSNPSELQLSRTIINEIITNKTSVLISDAKADPRFAEKKSIVMSEIKSAIAVPLFDEGKVLGVLYADTTNPLHSYSDDYLRVFAIFGNITASRLLNYSLLQERQAKEVLDAELKKAATIQRSLLISKVPEIDGYKIDAFLEQSRSVGGDLYDIKCLNDGRVLILIADVSGKGMGASLLMSNILAAFRILYEEKEFNLIDAVSKVSNGLCEYNKTSNFATLFVGLLDPTNNTLNYVNAGHNPPLHVSQDGQLQFLEATGMMIGAFDFATWEEKTLELASNDLIYMFTDGVTEADRTGEGDQFEDENLERIIVSIKDKSTGEINEVIMREINEFMGDAPRSDDITMITLKRD